jgi:4-hydroxy-2-oxoheptanedioate aldolase
MHLHPSLRATWEQGQTLFSVVLKLADPAVVELLGRCGFASVVIDQEHATLAEPVVEQLIRCAQGAGLAPVVRVQENRGPLIGKALDMGAAAVVVPHVTTAADAARAVRAAKFWPLGERGVDPTVRAGGYSTVPSADYYAASNRETALLVQVEGMEGVRNVEAIAATPGLDGIFIGPYDLSQSMGIPGQVRDPALRAHMRQVVQVCQAHGLIIGTFAATPEDVAHWVAAGIRYIWCGTDVGMLAAEARRVAAGLAASVQAAAAQQERAEMA